ncbi:malectin [Streptomyces sp. NBC_01476]|uniref:malectin domain-containing carbohydrate-binding protein n=1 Tax=Streptomyces sp. NBC_01476 TaxID=2903881 RepID=UPI002E32D056|nr:malectin domain-containing carbohydrate-binding protein [Streptomyces sp. NBC_01476]
MRNKDAWKSRSTVRNPVAVLTVAAALAAVGLAGAGTAQADPVAPGVSVDIGGSGDGGTFVADTYGTGGIPDTKPDSVASLPNWGPTVAHPIPAAVWNTSRFTESSYSVPGLTPGATYQLRLYFLDWYYQQAGKRVFDVAVDGATVLTDFDITGTAQARGADGQESFGVEEDFPVTVPADGTVTVDFIRGAENQPQVNALVIVPADS